jgi:hypothetical protein
MGIFDDKFRPQIMLVDTTGTFPLIKWTYLYSRVILTATVLHMDISLFYLKIIDQILFPTHVVRTKFDIYVFFQPLPIREVKIDSISH